MFVKRVSFYNIIWKLLQECNRYVTISIFLHTIIVMKDIININKPLKKIYFIV